MTEDNNKTIGKIIGILGGMGPEATIYLYRKILEATPASKDQDHITTIIYSNPKIPDRTAAILGDGPSPLPALIEGAKILERSGANFILMPCVTAHLFYHEIAKHVSIPFIHLLETSIQEILLRHGGVKRIGLIATRGTIETKLFQNILEKNGLQTIIPGAAGMELFHQAIYGEKGIKRGNKTEPKPLLLQIKDMLKAKGAQAIIAGCTEVPLVISQTDMDLPFINPLEILAREAVKEILQQ